MEVPPCVCIGDCLCPPPPVFRYYRALRNWRAFAEYVIGAGMPAEKELSIKDLCSLYRLADRQLKHSGPKMTRPDEKKLGEMLTLYKRESAARLFF